MTDVLPETSTVSETPVAVIALTYSDSIVVHSIDVTSYGPLVVQENGWVRLLPWHVVTDITFLDEPNIPEPPEPYVPERHEGSE